MMVDRKKISFLCVAGAIACSQWAIAQEKPASTLPMPYETKKLTYEEKTGLVHFEEGFKIWRGSQSLQGQTLTYDVNTQKAEAQDNLVFEQPNLLLRGSRLNLDAASETFHLRDGVTGHFQNET